MDDLRPDPDQLLSQLQSDEVKARRGKLKIFFGASAGVGKTYAMLGEARQQLLKDQDVVVGVLETHGRMETEVMADGLERLPMKNVDYRGRQLQEFDVDQALQRHPAIILVDELAHSNVAGSRHPKRWQDVEELLEAGIDVYTTVNVQHLETLNDIVSGITGIRVWETVPDHVFDNADEVVVVDLPPDELLDRLNQGKVYLAQQAKLAAKNFFRKGNLLALRELTLRRTADRVDTEMRAYRKQDAASPVWPTRESLLACIEPGERGEKIVRTCARLAAQFGVPWHAIYVHRIGDDDAGGTLHKDVAKVLKLAENLGAQSAALTAPQVASAVIRYARENNLSRLVMGRPQSRWRWPGQRKLGEAIEAQAEDLDLLRVALPKSKGNRLFKPGLANRGKVDWRAYGVTALLCALTVGVASALVDVLEVTNIVMLFLLTVVGVAMRLGRGPAVFAAFVGVGLFDFFFVPPRFSFNVTDVQYLLTFAVMLLVALVIGQLTAGLKVQVEAVTARERRVSGLYDMSRELSTALMNEQIAEIGARFLGLEFGVKTAVLIADDDNRLVLMPGADTEVDMGVAQWAYERGEMAGRGTDTLPASACLVLPLKATMRIRGAIAVQAADDALERQENRRLLETCASLMAISIERIHYFDVAQKTMVQMESERLRNSLLSAISHDLRTPLAAMVGLADSVELTDPPPTGQQAELIRAMRNSAMRMNALVSNLLDMARLESGSVKLNRQWQPLEEVVGSALAASHDVLGARPIRVELASDLPLLNLDSVLIERVFDNLLENAAKYTPPDSPIEIQAHAETDVVLIRVCDHGPGLPKGREEAIFDKFERGLRESATPGVGLGLAICRAIMQAHGGSIFGTTQESGGSCFVLRLPKGEPPADDGTESGGLEAPIAA